MSEGVYLNASEIAAHFEVTTRTIHRTVEYMRDRLKLPVGYCIKHKGYYYTEPIHSLPTIDISEGELLAITLTGQLIKEYKGTAIGKQLETAIQKVVASISDRVSVNFGSLLDNYSFEPSTANEIDPTIFQSLGKAIKDRQCIKMLYFTAQTATTKERLVEPLHLRNHLGEWYLIAFDHFRQEVRDFHLGRIRELKMTLEQFDPRPDFDLKSYLLSGFSMVRGSDLVEVELVFNEYQARWIREKAKLHPTEKREELADGRLHLSMQIGCLDAIKRFVLQFGANVEVVKPIELRVIIEAEAAQMTKIYAGKS